MTQEAPLSGLADMIGLERNNRITQANQTFENHQQALAQKNRARNNRNEQFRALLETPEITGPIIQSAHLIDSVRPGITVTATPPKGLELSIQYVAKTKYGVNDYRVRDLTEWDSGDKTLTRALRFSLEDDGIHLERFRKLWEEGGRGRRSHLGEGKWEKVHVTPISIGSFSQKLEEELRTFIQLPEYTVPLDRSQGGERQINTINSNTPGSLLYPVSIVTEDETRKQQALQQAHQRVADLRREVRDLKTIQPERKALYNLLLSDPIIEGLFTGATKVASNYPVTITITDFDTLDTDPTLELNWSHKEPGRKSVSVRTGIVIPSNDVLHCEGIQIARSRGGLEIKTTERKEDSEWWEGGGFVALDYPDTDTIRPLLQTIPSKEVASFLPLILSAMDTLKLNKRSKSSSNIILEPGRRIILL